jgi:crotonobetainyl-CoA:carnitine CoA-transferase CaiB-like acyl-CoA transferase
MGAVGALEGIKVVDLSVMISGPLAGMLLADQGADVIKVESPGLGDIMRILGSSKGGVTGIFLNNNRGKRSLVLDLKKPEGLDVLKRLISEADVLIQNFRPGAMERLGLGYEDAAKLNPNLIYTSISGYGPDGPFSHRRVYDNVIQAGSGLASVQTDPATGIPSMYRTLVCDKTTAYTAAAAITSALFARATGKAAGQHVVVSMLDAAIAFMWPDSAMDAVLLDDDVKRAPTIGANYAVTQLADGYVSAGAVSDAEFKGLVAALGHPEMGDDPRFATAPSRMQHLMELVTLMRQYASATTVEVFLARCDEITVFSKSSATHLLASYPDLKGTVLCRPHFGAVSVARVAPPPQGGGSLAVLGNINHQKGAGVLCALAAKIAREGGPKLVLIGNIDPAFSLPPSVKLHRGYVSLDIVRLAQLYGVGAWVMPSIWPETFSFSTYEMLATGLPVYGFDIGAQGEALARAPNGIPIPFDPDGDHAAAVLAMIRQRGPWQSVTLPGRRQRMEAAE